MKPTPCMGGWCRRRAACPNYNASDRRYPVERLCEPGKDGVYVVPVVITARPQSWRSFRSGR